MAKYNLRETTNNINSKAACDFLAQMLRELAKELEHRSDILADNRKNRSHIDDKSPVIFAANRVLTAALNGLCPATECSRLCDKYFLNYSDIWPVYERKMKRHRAEMVKRRNQNIIKWNYDGVSFNEIVKRSGLSRGQVSKIINRPPEYYKAKARGIPLSAYKRGIENGTI